MAKTDSKQSAKKPAAKAVQDVVAQLARKGARVAVLTADLVRDDAETRARFGVDCIMTKPISPRALAAFLRGGKAVAAADARQSPAVSAVEDILHEDIAGLGPAQTAEIVSALLADLGAAPAQLKAAPNPEVRRKLAHRLKGAAANFRLEVFCALMHRLQSDDLSALDQVDRVTSEAIRDLAGAARRAGLAVDQPRLAAKQ